ncbi:MAG TPA: helix-turn-helix domain-containing protein [Ktedonobacteraceae bacterium]|nr:helix-turn-helix domain-containing protein [Ktedonobacteraceae bacterium]
MAKVQYYNAQEAMRKLGISKSTFYYYVEEGRIHKHLPPHRKRGAFFLTTEIDEIANAQQQLKLSRSSEKQKTIFRKASVEDAQEVYEFAHYDRRALQYSGAVAENHVTYVSTSHAGIELIMPDLEVGHVLVRDGYIIGLFSILPLKYETLMQVMRKEVKIDEINPKDLAQYEPEEHVYCFILKVAAFDNKHVGAHLINKMLTFFHTLGKRGVEVDGVYAIATSREELNLCRRAGFRQMNLPGLSGSNWTPFELKVGANRNRFTKNYLQAIKSYKKRKDAENGS